MSCWPTPFHSSSLGVRTWNVKGKGSILQCPSQLDVPVESMKCKQSAGHSSRKQREARPSCSLHSPRMGPWGCSWTILVHETGGLGCRAAGAGTQQPCSPRAWARTRSGLYRHDRAVAGAGHGFLGRGRAPEAVAGWKVSAACLHVPPVSLRGVPAAPGKGSRVVWDRPLG